MVLTIKKGMTKKEIDDLLNQLPPSSFPLNQGKKPIDVTKYFGKLKLTGDVLETQRRMRDDSNYSY